MESTKKITDTLLKNNNGKLEAIIVFSHTGWNGVISRPREILTRMAKNRNVIFVEPPVQKDPDNDNFCESVEINDNLTLLIPHVHPDKINSFLTPVLNDLMEKKGIHLPILWFFSASYSSLADLLEHSGIIYDSMDFLTPLLGGYPELSNHDKDLLRKANLVVTAGELLFKSRKLFNNNTCLVSNTIDFDGFSGKVGPANIPDDMKAFKGPVVGYFGLIDKRIDFNLLQKVSKNMPEITFVLIGPRYIDVENEISGYPNICYLGDKTYDELPAYISSFSVGMFPVHLTPSCEYVIPTQMNEFIAMNKPVISTRMNEVVLEFGDEVSLINDHLGFVDKVNYYLNEPVFKKWLREKRYEDKKEIASWEETVELLENFIERLITKNKNQNLLNQNNN